MARYMVRTSYVDVVGTIWMPAATCAMRYPLDGYAIENMRGEDGTISRDNVEQWLASHSGDFQAITDFSASIEDGDDTLDFPWSDPDSELTYNDAMYREED